MVIEIAPGNPDCFCNRRERGWLVALFVEQPVRGIHDLFACPHVLASPVQPRTIVPSMMAAILGQLPYDSKHKR
ncbi:hypothetical protein BN2475_190174 [Paraburkholderia ribeironis]|uniref:Uncharacterized protein n=1 Tax=Paraburkholderia ribeironis TaxID=1247936 RepID=A0A1N7RW11_9BURK|nr:hypothetical protein BN2475_190174 [Paraburkholderia ribeironis]